MRKICIVLSCLLVSLAVMAQPAASATQQPGVKKHLRTARHTGAQPVANSPKEVGKKLRKPSNCHITGA